MSFQNNIVKVPSKLLAVIRLGRSWEDIKQTCMRSKEIPSRWRRANYFFKK